MGTRGMVEATIPRDLMIIILDAQSKTGQLCDNRYSISNITG